MQELFRFSVIRPSTRANPATVQLDGRTLPSAAPQPAPPPPPAAPPAMSIRAIRPAAGASLPAFIQAGANLGPGATTAAPPPAKSFQDQLRDIVRQLSGDNANGETIWQRVEPIAVGFVLTQSHAILTNSLWTSLKTFLADCRKALAASTPGSVFNQAAFSRGFDQQKAQPTLPDYALDLADLFIALLVVRRGGPANLDALIRAGKLWDATELLCDNPTLEEVADLIRIIELIKAGPAALAPPPEAKTASDVQVAMTAAFDAAMQSTLLLPAGIFAPLEKPVHGVGFRELHVVKQHIRRYELVEVGRIENILKGESRSHSQKHTLSNERDTFLQTDTTTEKDTELTSTDHVDIKNESQNQVKEDTKVDAGVHAQYDGGSFKLQADLSVSYDKATDDTKKYSSDVAKDVTQKAVNKVTQRVTQSQTTKIIETFEEEEDQAFDNKAGQGHVSGVYQWVEKVYVAQVFNLGRHMLLDIMVPEPGASLLAAATVIPSEQKRPVPPYPLGSVVTQADGKTPLLDGDGNPQLDVPLTPTDLSPNPHDIENFYGVWVARYGATSVEPPPTDSITVTKPLVFPYKDDDNKQANDSIRIDDGYGASFVVVSVDALRNDNPDDQQGVRIDVTVGALTLTFPWGIRPGDTNRVLQRSLNGNLANETGSISFTVYGSQIDQMNMNIEVTCTPLPSLTAKWQLQTYEKIRTAWKQLQSDYESKVAALAMNRATVGPLGAADEAANRATERLELKRACIAIMDNNNQTVRGVAPIATEDSPDLHPTDPLSVWKPVLPEPALALNQLLGPRVRWFEQAFEWENIAYVSYPYFWGRRKMWIDRLNLRNGDPLFVDFLRAGYARVVVPVRLGFEWAVHFYLHTGLPWLGGRLPAVGDKTQNPLYLDIAEEIKALTGGGESAETEIPIGDPWEYQLPTTLMKLRKDDGLPEWHRIALAGHKDDASYASDAPVGPWTWEDGAPR
jgi:hypothetical protein